MKEIKNVIIVLAILLFLTFLVVSVDKDKERQKEVLSQEVGLLHLLRLREQDLIRCNASLTRYNEMYGAEMLPF